ncbi:MAG: aldo/keto reductase [Clostridia bacterium]|nr:aldo/keto reductase [Clostridia bacterium]
MDLRPAKKMGFGMMRLPLLDESDQTSIDTEQVKKMVDLFMERGFTYFDTAWMYHDFASENVVKEALVDRYPRESFTLADKLHSAFFDTPEDMERIFNTQLEKTGAGYFDYYLMHGITADRWAKHEKLGCLEWIAEKKAKGLVKHVGFSFHDKADVLEDILTGHPEMEFVQLQLNYLDWESPWIQSRLCYEVCVKHGKPVIVMEPVKGGTLAKLPADAEKLFRDFDPSVPPAAWALRFCADLPGVMTVLSGSSSLEQMDQNTSFMESFTGFTGEEAALCARAAEIINEQTAIACTGCSYCTTGCPMQIAIPKYFSIYNEDMREKLDEKGWTATIISYRKLGETGGTPDQCIGCGQCESVCPQHLPIIELLQKLAAHFAIER